LYVFIGSWISLHEIQLQLFEGEEMGIIEFTCSECFAEISVDAKFTGTELMCDVCSTRTTVPSVDNDLSEQATTKEPPVILTTAPSLEGYRVTETLEIVTAESAFGIGVVLDYFAAFTDFFGGRSKSTQNVLRDARKACLRELKTEAYRAGADAVIAVDLDYSEFTGKGKSMLFLVASGTAVKVEKIDVSANVEKSRKKL
jgi:uncharacterized protein YbjQ (UPF0145 family)